MLSRAHTQNIFRCIRITPLGSSRPSLNLNPSLFTLCLEAPSSAQRCRQVDLIISDDKLCFFFFFLSFFPALAEERLTLQVDSGPVSSPKLREPDGHFRNPAAQVGCPAGPHDRLAVNSRLGPYMSAGFVCLPPHIFSDYNHYPSHVHISCLGRPRSAFLGHT